jgi:hypothetical protein
MTLTLMNRSVVVELTHLWGVHFLSGVYFLGRMKRNERVFEWGTKTHYIHSGHNPWPQNMPGDCKLHRAVCLVIVFLHRQRTDMLPSPGAITWPMAVASYGHS